jgi:hypothetical protein
MDATSNELSQYSICELSSQAVELRRSFFQLVLDNLSAAQEFPKIEGPSDLQICEVPPPHLS